MISADELRARIQAELDRLEAERRDLPDNEFRSNRERTINGTASGLVIALGIVDELDA